MVTVGNGTFWAKFVRREVTYRLMWQELKKLSLQLTGQIFTVVTFHADFEIAAHNAVRAEFDNVILFCCGFHLSQCWFRRIQSNRFLLHHYNSKDSEIGKWLKHFFGLRFLPPHEVVDGYLDLMSIIPSSNEALTDFSTYVLENYIVLARFPPELWASPPSKAPRTTNGPESFHSSYNKEFYHPHPSIHLVVEVLREIQSETDTKHQSIRMQSTKKPKKQSDARNDAAMALWDVYDKSKRSRSDRLHYLKKLGYLFQGKKI